MKKLFLLFSLALAFSFFTPGAVAQENLKPKTQEEIIAVFCHTWRFTAMEEFGTRLPPPYNVDFFKLVLKDDGTCIKTIPNREEIPCEWIYKPKVMTLVIKDKDGTTSSYVLVKLTEKEFIYKFMLGGSYSNLVMTRVEE